MASKLSISKERTAELIKEFGKNDQDSGSAEVQIAILSERIRNLTEHLKTHKKDNHTRRGLMMLIGKRRGMLKYIKERNIEEYRELIKKLGIRDNIELEHVRGPAWGPVFCYKRSEAHEAPTVAGAANVSSRARRSPPQ